MVDWFLVVGTANTPPTSFCNCGFCLDRFGGMATSEVDGMAFPLFEFLESNVNFEIKVNIHL
jgi:hypothetical protein